MASSDNESDARMRLLDEKEELSQLLKELQQSPKHGKETRVLNDEQAELLAGQIKKLLKKHLN